MKNIIITGARGFIAQHIAKILKDEGFYIIGISRKTGLVPNFDETFYGSLGEPLRDVYDKYNIDVVIHCAYDIRDVDDMRNAAGTYVWADQAEKNNVGMQIFMSSISACEDAIAPYGQKKYELERWFLDHNHIILRLGLVTGNGGLFGRIISTVKKSPVIPLINGGKVATYVTDVDTLSRIVSETVQGKNKVERGRIWFLQQTFPHLFVDILKEIQRQSGLFRIFIPVPYFLALAALTIIEKIKFLKLGLNTNNLRGMKQLSSKRFKSDLDYLGYPDIPIEMLIQKCLDH
jgi:nucleoside-diphosphate-sugar epimerase